MAKLILAAGALLLAASGASAQMTAPPPAPPQDGAPMIPRDGRPVTTQGSIQGFNFINYRVQVEAGEVMIVNFRPDVERCYFNITDPNGGLVFWSGKGGNTFSGAPQMAGEFTIKVFNDDRSARRSLACNFEISFSAQPR